MAQEILMDIKKKLKEKNLEKHLLNLKTIILK